MTPEPIDLDAELSQLLDAESAKAARRREGYRRAAKARSERAARMRELRDAARERISKLSRNHPWWCTDGLPDRWELDPVTMERDPDAQARRTHQRVVGTVTVSATEFEDGRFSQVSTFISDVDYHAGPDTLRASAADLYAAADLLDKINATEWWNVDSRPGGER